MDPTLVAGFILGVVGKLASVYEQIVTAKNAADLAKAYDELEALLVKGALGASQMRATFAVTDAEARRALDERFPKETTLDKMAAVAASRNPPEEDHK